MTTKVTVDAHAGWDVVVHLLRGEFPEQTLEEEIVDANTTKDYYIHRGLSIVLVQEVPNE